MSLDWISFNMQRELPWTRVLLITPIAAVLDVDPVMYLLYTVVVV